AAPGTPRGSPASGDPAPARTTAAPPTPASTRTAPARRPQPPSTTPRPRGRPTPPPARHGNADPPTESRPSPSWALLCVLFGRDRLCGVTDRLLVDLDTADLSSPLGAGELEDLRWYLEDYLLAPFGVYETRGSKVAGQLP